MKYRAGDWLEMKPVDRYMAIWKTAKNNAAKR